MNEKAPIVDVSSPYRSGPEAILQPEPATVELLQPSPAKVHSLIKDRPRAASENLEQRPPKIVNEAELMRPQSATGEIVRGRLVPIPNLESHRRHDQDETALLKPDEEVNGLLRSKNPDHFSEQSRPSVDDKAHSLRHTDATLLTLRPEFEADIDRIRKKESRFDVSRPRPNLDVTYSKLPDEPELSTDANVINRKEQARIASGKAGKLDGSPDVFAADNKISWDRWYADVSRMCEPLLTEAVEKHGNPAGSNRIRVTIWRDHHLVAKTVNGQNRDFNEAVLEAYQSLNGSASLEFPPGSKRRKVEFFVDHAHDTADPVSGVNSRSIVGDDEVQFR